MLNSELIIPSIYSFYESLNDGYFVTQQIVESIKFFNDPKHSNYYLDIVNSDSNNFHNGLVFFDNNYWNFRLLNSTYLINNHFVWNYLNSPNKMTLFSYDFWMNLYPVNINQYNWFVADKTLYKIVTLNNFKEIYDIQFVSPRQLKHHDYTNDIYVCSNLFWQQYINTKTTLWGFNFFWYENYGAVEIGLKIMFNYWYQLMYPALETDFMFDRADSIKVLNTIYSDSIYFNNITRMVLDHNVTERFTE